jgi:hypothetical protein
MTLKEEIQKDITCCTYRYFQAVDLYFRDYIYGDPYYTGLADVVVRYVLLNNLDWAIDHRITGIIDLVELVSRHYEVFIKADIYFRRRNSDIGRERKNYLMKSLRKATGRLLDEQYNKHNLLCQDLEDQEASGYKFVSIYAHEGQVLDRVSWNRWREDQAKVKNNSLIRQRIEVHMNVLNDQEKTVIELLLDGKSRTEICEAMQIDCKRLRKVTYSLKTKIRNRSTESTDTDNMAFN